MELQTVWFILIGILFTGFFLLEGFDYGVGILLPFLGKDDTDRRVIINSIGPFWDGNEVWMITAGGAMFAAFPNWYATLFSGFYLALVLMLVALIVRGVGFEFRSKDKHPAWRTLWDWMIFVGSLVPALLWGVAFANVVRGVPIDADMQYVGGFWNLLNPYALLVWRGGGVGLYAARRHLFEPEDQGRACGAGAQGCGPALGAHGGIGLGRYHRGVLCHRHVQSPGPHPLAVCPGGRRGSAGCGLVHPRAPSRLGLCHVQLDDSAHVLYGGAGALSPRDGIQPQRQLEPDYLQCLIQPVYPAGHEYRCPGFRAHCAALPGLELLGVSPADRSGGYSRVLGWTDLFANVL